MFWHDLLHYIQDPKNQYGQHIIDFLKICLVPIIASIVITVPLGFAVARRPVLAFIASNISGLFRAIPTVAILLLMLSIHGLGIGFKSAVIALTVIGIPPILLNTVAGVRSIDPAAIDAARGMGMNSWQVLTRIEIPLALPIVIAGVRTSAVQIVATAPLAAFIGAGGLGLDIVLGFFFESKAGLVAGAAPVGLIAIVTEFGLAAVQRAITPIGVRIAQEDLATTTNTSDNSPAQVAVSV